MSGRTGNRRINKGDGGMVGMSRKAYSGHPLSIIW